MCVHIVCVLQSEMYIYCGNNGDPRGLLGCAYALQLFCLALLPYFSKCTSCIIAGVPGDSICRVRAAKVPLIKKAYIVFTWVYKEIGAIIDRWRILVIIFIPNH